MSAHAPGHLQLVVDNQEPRRRDDTLLARIGYLVGLFCAVVFTVACYYGAAVLILSLG